ncbi:GGDEF domain-containing protein [Hyphomicrobium methylovorum]|nr:GGDEF domain-containing protein [Hyphomicrobium methylovorum]
MMQAVSRHVPLSAMIMLSSVLIICATYVFWIMYMRTGGEVAALSPWSDVSWRIAEVDSRGRIIRLGSHPIAIAALFGLVSVGLLGFAVGAWQYFTGNEMARRADNKAQSQRLDKVGRDLDDEVSSLVTLLQQHLEVSSSHSDALASVNRNLPTLTSPEQIRAVVQRLINENARFRGEVDVLNGRLRQSQTQIEKLRANLNESQRLGMIDAVTSLKNRHWLQANMEREVRLAMEANEPLSVIMADVDHFKKINDTFGHAVGDEILRRFGELLSKSIKGRDTAVRYGGEEFIVLLPQTKLLGAVNLGEQLRAGLESKRWMHHRTGKPIGTVTASFGVAQMRPDDSPETLIDRADGKLYEAKAAGRNCVKSEVDDVA